MQALLKRPNITPLSGRLWLSRGALFFCLPVTPHRS